MRERSAQGHWDAPNSTMIVRTSGRFALTSRNAAKAAALATVSRRTIVEKREGVAEMDRSLLV